MAKNIFSQRQAYFTKPKRNVFDLSFQNNLTMEFGKLYPVFCKEVIPGDSFRIKPTFALRMLPLVFPVQTRMQANLHFFYVRNRNLWKSWKKFIGHTETGLTPPYIRLGTSKFATRGLADYLGIPTVAYGDYTTSVNFDLPNSTSVVDNESRPFLLKDSVKSLPDLIGKPFFDQFVTSTGSYSNNTRFGIIPGYTDQSGAPITILNKRLGSTIFLRCSEGGQLESGNTKLILVVSTFDSKLDSYKIVEVVTDISYAVSGNSATVNINTGTVTDSSAQGDLSVVDYLDTLLGTTSDGQNTYNYRIALLQTGLSGPLRPYSDWPSDYYGILSDGEYTPVNANVLSSVGFNVNTGNGVEINDMPNGNSNPFINDIHVSALPFRAYESIYNAFYRNEQNDPLFVDGKPEYDVYCPNVDDGADDYDYHLHYRNWEPDFLTSAVQSPQQGVAPLVGVSSTGNFQFAGKDSDGNVSYFNATAVYADDGNTITGFKLSDDTTVNPDDLQTPNVKADVALETQKQATIYNMNQLALTGISINDFRNVNALQRWLETNIRRGYKYKDQLLSHYGVDIRYDELDMPEFIGGMSEPIYVNQVNATSANGEQPLGDYAGQASVLATANHSVEHYCDEHGFIIGILSVSPVPNYSQLLPKMYLKDSYLDYFFPEFGHLGLQPITYREVAPLQTKMNSIGTDASSNLSKTFGYQRPWYDYIASVDEVHGLFRTELRNFVCNRVFNSPPVLNHDFLKVDPEQLNDIFAVTSTTDKILGQIWFDVTAKRPIPRMGIPRLE